MFILDSTVPDPTTCKGYVPGNAATICGDITSFNIDPNTGRLSLITNQTVVNPKTNTNLSYFPVGSSPIKFTVVPASYYYSPSRTAMQAARSIRPRRCFVYANNNGQLTLSQNTPIPYTG